MSALMMNDPAVAARIAQPGATIQGAPTGTTRLQLTAPIPAAVGGARAPPAIPANWALFSLSATGGGLTKDHLQAFSYTQDGTYGAGLVERQGMRMDMHMYPTAQAGICAINMGTLDATRAGAITIGAGGTANIACPSTTANSRLVLMYIGGDAAVPAVATFVRTAGTGFKFAVTGTAAAQYHYLIVN